MYQYIEFLTGHIYPYEKKLLIEGVYSKFPQNQIYQSKPNQT